ncbi:DUF2478 domain-containing protein [Bradyrhizobium neotropicale]|uniref:3-dehydroquinate dehydratase n=1 Tax=Bradyrhizobium neotropicale TaxID=1497615 RepID=A0A176ZHE2_9BRAD|nr:DUF2478 domain-containing protein [Bradyrhizobium neotropicale]OAF19303.1 hypothetical protein AXW67_36545 [Bradyrhizobium neotropicale]
MTAMKPVTAGEEKVTLAPSLAAIVYPDNVYPDAAFAALVTQCRSLGLSLAGVLQRRVSDAPNRRCDVLLEDLSTGHCTSIFEDRGAGAAGCRLDEAALTEAAARIEGNMEDRPDLLILNKFGKAECSGGGLLDLIASAMDRQITIVIGVPKTNLQAWRDFAGSLSIELSEDIDEIEQWAARLK